MFRLPGVPEGFMVSKVIRWSFLPFYQFPVGETVTTGFIHLGIGHAQPGIHRHRSVLPAHLALR